MYSLDWPLRNPARRSSHQVLQATAQTACDLEVLLKWATAGNETVDLGRFFNSDGTAILIDKFTFTVSSSGSKSVGWGARRTRNARAPPSRPINTPHSHALDFPLIRGQATDP